MALLDLQVDFSVNKSTKLNYLVLKQFDVDFEEEVDIPPDYAFQDWKKTSLLDCCALIPTHLVKVR
jgi:hypothetical protein